MGPPDPVPGLLLGIIAIALINRNRRFLVGQHNRAQVVEALHAKALRWR